MKYDCIKNRNIDCNNGSMKKIFIPILILQNLTVFFTDIVKSITALQGICIVLYLAGILWAYNGKIEINKCIKLWLFYVMAVFFNYFVGGDAYFIVSFLIFNAVMILNMNIKGLSNTQYHITKICVFIHLAASLAVYLLPETLINSIFSVLLGDAFNTNYSWRIISGANPGMTAHIGTNATILSLCFMLCAVEIFEKGKNKWFYGICMLLSFLMILTTQKRSALLFSVLVMVIYYATIHFERLKYLSGKRVIAVVILIVFLIVFVRWLLKSDIAEGIISKTTELMKEGDLSNGRIGLMQIALKYFNESPILGVGLKKIYNNIGYDVHNTYLQILAEMGILGFLFFVIGITSLTYKSNILVKKVQNQHNLISIEDKSYVENKDACVVGLGYIVLLFMLIYGFVGNTFIEYMPIMIFCLSVTMIHGK